ncbi:MAG: hypothetical protein ACE5NG_07140 [bacterium]
MVFALFRRVFLVSVVAVCLFVAYGQGFSGELTISVSFSTSDLIIHKVGDFDAVKLADCDVTRTVGEPQLPVKSVHVALPPGAVVEQVDVLSTESEELEGTFRIYPVQPPQILRKPGEKTLDVEFVDPKE